MHDDKNNSNSSESAAVEDKKRLKLLLEIDRILASTEKVRVAVPLILETICRNLQFEIGEFWVLNESENNLRLESFSHLPSASLIEFADESRKFQFSKGEGLPGIVWQKNEPVWVENFNTDKTSIRRLIAERADLQSAFAFPIRCGGKFLGAFCFFCKNICPRDEDLLQIFVSVGGNVGQTITRERVEADLRQSEIRYRAFIKQSTEGIWRLELDEKIPVNLSPEEQVEMAVRFGYLAECNDAMAQMYGLEKAENLIGCRIPDLFDMQDAKNYAYLLAFIESGYHLTDAESHEKDINGNDKFFLNSLVGTIENDYLIRVWGTQRDITEQKIAQEKLRDSEETFRNMADNAPVMIWLTDAGGYCHYLSQSWYQFTGQTPEIGLGFGWLDAAHPDDRPLAEKIFLAANERTEAFDIEYRLRGRDGNYIWAIDSAQPRFGKDGEFLGYIGSVINIDERKTAEESLRESEERYRTLFETMDEGFCLCEMLFDAHGKPFDYRFLEVNPVFEQMTGLKNAVGKTALELIPNLESHWMEIYGKVVLTGKSVRFTDGSETMNRWFDVYASRVGGADSRKFSLLFNNITERKNFETALKESQEHLALALKIGRAGTFEWNIAQNVNKWSPEIEEMYGVPTGTFEGNLESWAKRVEPEDAENIIKLIKDALDNKSKDLEYEFRAVLPDDSRRWFAGRARFLYDENNEPLSMIGINVDINQRKENEIALHKARTRLEATLTAGEIGTWTWDITNNAVSADKNLARMFSVSEANANGGEIENYIAAIHSDDRERVAAIILDAVENGDDYEADYRLISAEGKICWVIARGTVERDSEGKPIHLNGVVLDITERKEAESERERLFIEAQKAREIAERANHSKDEFIALVSHELRSPLNAMLGWTRVLQRKQTDEKMTDYALDVIVRNALSQSRLIEDLLDIARIGEGKLRLEIRETRLIPIINTAVETIKPAADGKNISIIQSIDSTANLINGDDERLRQVLENLLSNAVKFTSDGGTVKISLERSEELARIVVSDTGQGISGEFLPQIFEKFRQADASTTRRHGGLGIGLSLARDLVELHSGTISAHSEGEGTGATFTVTLPLRTVMPIKQNSDTEGNMGSQGKLNGFWILAVDDEADAREIVSFMLQINGAKVTTANSAVEALEILKDCNGHIPDILLSDISMPFESGYALLEKIRALPSEKGGQIPAVALTAFNRPEDREAAFEAGFQKHLGKPVDMDVLIEAIVETAGAKQI